MQSLSRRVLRFSKRLGRWRQRMRETPAGRVQLTFLTLSCIALPYLCCGLYRLPGGYVGVVEDWWGRFRDDMYDDEKAFFIFPIYEKLHILRVWPVRKRLSEEFVSKDKKVVQAVVHIRLRAKAWWGPEIVKRLGTDFGRSFVLTELALDTEKIVAEHDYADLVADDDTTESICEELIQRTKIAALFHHLDLLDMTVQFRDPLDAPDPNEAPL